MVYYFSDQILKYKISETYIKLKIDYNSDKKQTIRRTLKQVAEKQIADFKYKDGLIVVIEIEKGSLKTKVVIYGTVIIQGIANYGSIRQGINQKYDDVKTVSERVIQSARQDDIDIDNNVIRTEKRTGLIGRLKRTLDRIEYLQTNLNNLGNNKVQEELISLRQDLANIIELLNQEERLAILNSLPTEIGINLPEPQDKGMKHIYNLYALKPKDIEENDDQNKTTISIETKK
jgi:hypothetical protein